jgi:hypothetical protein
MMNKILWVLSGAQLALLALVLLLEYCLLARDFIRGHTRRFFARRKGTGP